MKQTAELVTSTTQVDLSKDGVIIRRNDSSYSTVLDVTGIAADTTIPAGRMLIRTKASGAVKPQTVTAEGAYTEPTASTEEYAGVLGGSILVSNPQAVVVERGEVNANACDVAPSAAGITALKHILFTNDH